jgi:hypothetical protein
VVLRSVSGESTASLATRVEEWRIRIILAFDDQWLLEAVSVKQALPRSPEALIKRSRGQSDGKIGAEALVAAG